MSLASEALEYWTVSQRYRHSLSEVGKTYAATVDVPSLYHKAKNLRINAQLSNIMSQEGVHHDHDDDSTQSPNSGS